MSIELPEGVRPMAVASIERYFRENMEEPIGNLTASGLLNFFVEEIGPLIYNRAVVDIQERLQAREFGDQPAMGSATEWRRKLFLFLAPSTPVAQLVASNRWIRRPEPSSVRKNCACGLAHRLVHNEHDLPDVL